MSTSLYKKNNRKKRSLNFAIIILIIIAMILVGWYFLHFVKSKTMDQKPLISQSTIYNTALPKSVLVNKINELKTTLESYEAEIKTARLANRENSDLKAELGREVESKGILAHLITLPNRSIYDTFMIDAGQDQGVKIGQVAYGFGSIALGTVSAVDKDHSTLLLFSAAGRTTSGTAGENNVAVTLIGRGSGEYEVRLPRDLSFTVGGLIAYQSSTPSVLAEVERIVTDPRDPFQRLIAKTPLNLQALKWVTVK